MRLSFHPGFGSDLIMAARWYEAHEPKLGHLFIDEVDQAIQIIAQHPLVWRAVKRDIRRYLLKRFPYGIHYRVIEDGQAVRFLTLKHGARSPEAGLRRM